MPATAKYYVALFSAMLSCSAFGQKKYSVHNPAYTENHFSEQLIIADDSTCWLKSHYANNSTYDLYKGHIRKLNDTLLEYTYRPVVEFGCNMRYHYRSDSVDFEFYAHDTVISDRQYKLGLLRGGAQTLTVKYNNNIFFVAGAGKKEIVLQTKFIDPLTKQTISMSVVPMSSPQLVYYGSTSPLCTVTFHFDGKSLVLYPDHVHLWEKEVFVSEK